MRTFAFALVLVVSVAGPSVAFAGSKTTGSWSGEMRQIDPTAERTYPMTLTIDGKKGASSYPSLKCGGTLTRVAEAKGYSIYREQVANETGGTCVGGMIIVTPDAGRLVLGWFTSFEGEPLLASAVLKQEATAAK